MLKITINLYLEFYVFKIASINGILLRDIIRKIFIFLKYHFSLFSSSRSSFHLAMNTSELLAERQSTHWNNSYTVRTGRQRRACM